MGYDYLEFYYHLERCGWSNESVIVCLSLHFIYLARCIEVLRTRLDEMGGWEIQGMKQKLHNSWLKPDLIWRAGFLTI